MVAREDCRTTPYTRRRPEQTSLYQLVQEHLETYLALVGEGDWGPPSAPAQIEREFRRYLECGILAHGFARARCDDCGHNFLVAFSCKGRGICPSCTTRRMAETAAHLSDHVFPRVPVRQCVLSLPKRLRYYLERDPKVACAVLHIFLRVVEAHLRRLCPEASERARFGAVSFVHRFGSSLNRHLHFHCCVIDGVFELVADSEAHFHPARATTPAEVEALTEQVRRRVLRWFSRSGILEQVDANDMLDWANGGGFSLDVSVRIGADDRAGLERLLRYCARPTFALERLQAAGPDRVIYRLPKPAMDGRTELVLTPLEFLDRIAALIPPPRRHRHRYHGVLAPNSPLRQAVTAYRRESLDQESLAPHPDRPPAPEQALQESACRSPARYLWAVLLARLFETFPLKCPRCGGQMRLLAFVTEGATIQRILNHIGEPAQAPTAKPARGPPFWDEEPEPGLGWEGRLPPEPEFEFDQRISW